jgi:hypothetical protein
MTLKLYRKSEWLTLRLHGEALARLRKPTTPEWVDAVGALPKIDLAVVATVAAVRGTLTGPVDLTIPGAEIEALARWLARWTLDLAGAEDEEGGKIMWAELDERERAELWEAVPIDDLTHAWSCLRLAQMDNGRHLDAARKVAMTGVVVPDRSRKKAAQRATASKPKSPSRGAAKNKAP